MKSHDYFNKWKIIKREELFVVNNCNVPDEKKLKKAQLKLRVLLHPDKLPKDFDSKQTFVSKILWDISNDALEEFMKSKDDLDWVNR